MFLQSGLVSDLDIHNNAFNIHNRFKAENCKADLHFWSNVGYGAANGMDGVMNDFYHEGAYGASIGNLDCITTRICLEFNLRS